MPFKTNSDGSRTWTNSSGSYSTTRDQSGRLTNVTSTHHDGSHGFSKDYNNGKVTNKKSW
jgi:hypothetical protein